MKEANFNIVYTFFFFFFLLLNLNTYVSAFNPSSPCNGSIAECNEEEMEMVMESDISRRFLEEIKKKYISPGALRRDQPVCNGGASGQPYSKSDGCLPPPSHPYNRGCSAYYRCRDDA
ncbi:hypothetical protein BUALT_Bualt09G0015800 [Buddleja alternifolia]|uniref:Protein RALF-like 32 n=1 Tax=Buddleja alternifolia TaxID=168488 RepID=A0AAV6XA11_9LAMI|nr:hypothetical protein BUALT_Bualt09G0015800 [Buddleja alternifolia]